MKITQTPNFSKVVNPQETLNSSKLTTRSQTTFVYIVQGLHFWTIEKMNRKKIIPNPKLLTEWAVTVVVNCLHIQSWSLNMVC